MTKSRMPMIRSPSTFGPARTTSDNFNLRICGVHHLVDNEQSYTHRVLKVLDMKGVAGTALPQKDTSNDLDVVLHLRPVIF